MIRFEKEIKCLRLERCIHNEQGKIFNALVTCNHSPWFGKGIAGIFTVHVLAV